MLLVLATLVAGTLVSLQLVRAESISPWGATTTYPVNINSESCVENLGYIYCVAGNVANSLTSLVYYAQISPSGGVGAWTKTTSLPENTAGLSCVAPDQGALLHAYIYCLGDGTANVFVAQISSSGVGTWTKTTNYPISISHTSCVTFSGFSGFMSHSYIACVGGETGSGPTGAIYYAIAGTGAGAWTSSTTYPVGTWQHSCVLSQGYIYCVAGSTTTTFTNTNAVFYASIGVLGVSSWTATTGYPAALGYQSCVTNSGFAYCMGGANGNNGNTVLITNHVNYAALSSSGVGTWTGGTNYPFPAYLSSCVQYSGYIYCVAGFNGNSAADTNAVYYSEIVHPPTATVTISGPTTTVTTSVTGPTSTTTITALKTTTHTTTLTKTVTKTVASTTITKTTTATRTVTTHVPTLGPSNDTGGPSAASILPASTLAVILSAMALGGAGLFFVAVPQRLDYFRRKLRQAL